MYTMALTLHLDNYMYTCAIVTSNTMTITRINNAKVTNKSILVIPLIIGDYIITNVTALIPKTVKSLTVTAELSNLKFEKGCVLSSLTINKGSTTTTIGNCQALPIATGCTLTIGEGVTVISADAFKNCKNFLLLIKI